MTDIGPLGVPHAAAFPARIGVVDVALEALGVEACRSAPNRDPGELGSITLMLPRNRPGGGVPIGAGRDPGSLLVL